jgi:hypothetical protein
VFKAPVNENDSKVWAFINNSPETNESNVSDNFFIFIFFANVSNQG